MWNDTTPRAQQIGAWLDSPMDLDELYGRTTFARCAVVLAVWLSLYPVRHISAHALRGGGL